MKYIHVDSIHVDCTICQRRACGQTRGMSEQREREVNSRPTGSTDSPRGHMHTIPLPGGWGKLAVGSWQLVVGGCQYPAPWCLPDRGMGARPAVSSILLPAPPLKALKGFRPCSLPPDRGVGAPAAGSTLPAAITIL